MICLFALHIMNIFLCQVNECDLHHYCLRVAFYGCIKALKNPYFSNNKKGHQMNLDDSLNESGRWVRGVNHIIPFRWVCWKNFILKCKEIGCGTEAKGRLSGAQKLLCVTSLPHWRQTKIRPWLPHIKLEPCDYVLANRMQSETM